jgi:hypothetical protein
MYYVFIYISNVFVCIILCYTKSIEKSIARQSVIPKVFVRTK